MAFERLQSLGEEKFRKVLNALERKETSQKVARAIQQQPPDGWGDLQDMTEMALMQQLHRLRHAAADGIFGAAEAKRLASKPNITRLAHISVPILARMETLSESQCKLVEVLLAKATKEERTYTSVNDAVDNYRQTLIDLQKLRFDLGLDEFKGPVGGVMRGASVTTTFPDGMSVQKQIFEAVTTLEQIFDKRKIPQITAGE